jgi:hypothetical protein
VLLDSEMAARPPIDREKQRDVLDRNESEVGDDRPLTRHQLV